jgi:hypothetical protein
MENVADASPLTAEKSVRKAAKQQQSQTSFLQ